MEEILDCVVNCDLERLKFLLKRSNVNGRVPGTDGFTPLHVVAGAETDDESCYGPILSYLFDKGADPNSRTDENLTPVHVASMWNRCFQLKIILQHGGDPWLLDNNNKNSFDLAADNNSYEAYQLLNIYHAEGKLNFKPEKKELKKITFATPETFSTPKYYERSLTDNLNNSLNLTFYSANSSKFMSPSVFSTPINWANSKFEVENLNESVNCTFMSAKEHFPVIFSSNDESDDISDASEFLKKLTVTKSENYLREQTIDISDDKNHKDVEEINLINENREKILENEKYKNNLNNAYIFTSSSESSGTTTSGTTTSDLNDSDDSTQDTIVDNTDNDDCDIILIKTVNDTVNLCSSNSSVCIVPNDWKSFHNVTSDCSTLSYCSSHSKSSLIVPENIQKFSNTKIFEELKNMGDNPGPVLDHTRHVYLHRLVKLMSGCAASCDLPKPKYCPEIYLYLEKRLELSRANYLQDAIEKEFDADTSREWREGNQKCCFNYFLLDPRVTQNLPQRSKQLTHEQTFMVFLDALFYIGKGTKGRPYSHLFEAAKSIVNDRPKSAKVNHILDIWDAGLGVISLHCFHNSIPVEAYTKEACAIEAIGLDNLTNIKKGDYYGLCTKLTSSRKRLIGILLLQRALQIFLIEGEKGIRPKDVKRK